MYDKILVPLDGSKLAEGILPFARTLARGLKTPVELLTAIDPEVIKLFIDPAHGRYVDAVEGDIIRNGAAYLDSIARSFPDPTRVSATVKIGKAAEVITDQAASAQTLIAMSTHGRTGVQRWFLGSVADKVLHGTKKDLLLVRGNKTSGVAGEAALKTVLLPLDGSSLAEQAVPRAAALATSMKLTLVLLRAYALPATAYYGDDAYVPDIERLTDEIRKEAKSYLDGKQSALRAEGLSDVSAVLLQGDASAQIIDYACGTEDNLVAMCTHGRSGLGRWVLGSVTDRVVRHSGDPVLIVRAAA